MQKVSLVTLLTIAQFQSHIVHIHSGGITEVEKRSKESWSEMSDSEMDALIVNRGNDLLDDDVPIEFDGRQVAMFAMDAGLTLFYINNRRPLSELAGIIQPLNSSAVTILIEKIKTICGDKIDLDYVNHYISSHVTETDDPKAIVEQACKLNILYMTIKSQLDGNTPILDAIDMV